MKAIHILWDADNAEELESLPEELDIPEGMTDEEKISDYLSALTGYCHRGFSLSTEEPAHECTGISSYGKETKEMRFRRVAEARVNKIIKMIRLLGNCSNSAIYTFTEEQAQQIFATLKSELNQAQKRYIHSQKYRFSLSEVQQDTLQNDQTIVLSLPDGSWLRAVAYEGGSYPAINIYWDTDAKEIDGPICFAEYNPERSLCYKVCIGVYQSDQEDTTYYEPYMAERNVNEKY